MPPRSRPARRSRHVFMAVAMLLVAVAMPMPLAAQAASRAVALTIDDLPATRITNLPDARAMTSRLLAGLAAWRIAAVGFVNESKLDQVPAEREGRVALLAAWLEAGQELGNHTYSHLRLYDATLAAFEADVLRGERETRALMAERGRVLRYFRHPTLNTGRDRDTKAAAEAFLAARGYTVAPVTIDSDEYLYAAAYDRLRARADSAGMQRVGADYLRYMAEMLGYYEALSRALFGREPAQVLLLHANWLNADYLGQLAGVLTGRGYRFVSLEEALRDGAYGLPDEYVGSRGPSWLERWAITAGTPVPATPQVPQWVTAVAP